MTSLARRFSEAEDDYIRANYSTVQHRNIAAALGRGVVQVRKRAARLGVTSSPKRWSSEEDAVLFARRGDRVVDVARELGRNVGQVVARWKRLTGTPWRRPSGMHAGRPVDGFVDGRPVYSHRSVVEAVIGRALRSDEIVHHIDLNKTNNSPENLHVFETRAAHRLAHFSLEEVAADLVVRGLIVFDRNSGRYEIGHRIALVDEIGGRL